MFRVLLFLYALLIASLALASEKDTRSCAQKTHDAHAQNSLVGLATSIHETSLYTLGWSGREIFRLTDKPERIGKASVPLTRLTRLPRPVDAWKNIAQVTVQSEANSILGSRAVVALSDADGALFIFDTDEMQPARVPYQPGKYLVALALTKAQTTQLAVFSNLGIEVVDLPQRLDHEVRLRLELAYPATGMTGGFAVQRDDYVAFDKHGQITRYTKGKAKSIAKLPQGIRSLGGYLAYGSLCLWAIDAHGVLWRKTKDASQFRRWRAQMPAGVSALRLSAASKVVFPESHFREDWNEGYFSRVSSSSSSTYAMAVNRVLIVGDDGAAYSALPSVEGQTELVRLEPYQDLLTGMAAELPTDSLSLVQGSRLSPGEVRLAMKKLADQRETFFGKEHPLSEVDQALLLRTWLTHLRHERYLDTPGSGIEEALTRIGVPPQRAARLIFLACLSFQELEDLLNQRDLDSHWSYFQRINELLLLDGHTFRKQVARNPQLRRMLDYFSAHVRTYMQAEKDRFLDQILESPFSDQSIYVAMDAFFAQRTYLWHWDLPRQIDDTNAPGPKGTTGGASVE